MDTASEAQVVEVDSVSMAQGPFQKPEDVKASTTSKVSTNVESILKAPESVPAAQNGHNLPQGKEDLDGDKEPSPVIMDSVELTDNPSGDLENLEEDEDDDLVVYDEGAEQLELTGRLSELSRRTTQETVVEPLELVGSIRRGQIENLLAAPLDEYLEKGSDGGSSILGDSDIDNELAALQAEVEREVSDVGRRALMSSLSRGMSVGDSVSSGEASSNKKHVKINVGDSRLGEQQSSSLSGVSPVTLNHAAFREAQQGLFADVPLMVDNHGGVFEGLVYCETVDSLGRPIVVVNTSAIPKKSLRNQAFEYISKSLEGIISKGPYILIFAAIDSEKLAKVPAAWIVAAYRKLTRPFKKNVEYLILVRPNRVLRGILKIMSFVVKKKARNKVKQVSQLSSVGLVTNGEVQVEHLSLQVLSLFEGNEKDNESSEA